MDNKRLPGKVVWGYGIAGVGNNTAATLFYTYFIFYLTTVAGVSPVVAGAITSVAVLWDGLNDPLIGYWSDNCKSKYGRRRPFQITGLVPLVIIIVGMFVNPDFSAGGKAAYYMIVNILFWFIFTWTDVPTIALADSLDGTYEDHARARTAWTVCVTAAGLVAMDFPPLVVEHMEKSGLSESRAWFWIAVAGAIITFFAYFISWNATRGKEIIPDRTRVEEPGATKAGFFKQYANTFKNKSMRYACVGILIYYTASSGSVSATLNYILQYNLELSGSKTSMYLFVYSIFQILGSYVLGMVFAKFDKKIGGRTKQLAYINIILGIVLLAAYFVGSNSVVVLIIFVVVGFGSAVFWLHGWDVAIDASKVELYKTGDDHAGEYTAFIGFSFKLGGAIGMWLVGLILQMTGFNGEAAVQSASALNGIMIVFYIVSGICFLLAGFVFYKSPLTRAKLDAVLEGIEKKKRGESVDESEFADLL